MQGDAGGCKQGNGVGCKGMEGVAGGCNGMQWSVSGCSGDAWGDRADAMRCNGDGRGCKGMQALHHLASPCNPVGLG